MKRTTKKSAKKSTAKKKATKKIARKKVVKRKRNPVCDSNQPDAYMYTNIASYIRKNDDIMNLMEYRYGPFFSGIVDDMDATYATQLKLRPGLKPGDFIDWYIDNRKDVENAKEVIDHNGWGQPIFVKEMKELIKRLNKIDNK